MEEIIVCVTNKCPFCGERSSPEGVDSVKIGEKIKCEKCGKEFEVSEIKKRKERKMKEGNKKLPLIR